MTTSMKTSTAMDAETALGQARKVNQIFDANGAWVYARRVGDDWQRIGDLTLDDALRIMCQARAYDALRLMGCDEATSERAAAGPGSVRDRIASGLM